MLSNGRITPVLKIIATEFAGGKKVSRRQLVPKSKAEIHDELRFVASAIIVLALSALFTKKEQKKTDIRDVKGESSPKPGYTDKESIEDWLWRGVQICPTQ